MGLEHIEELAAGAACLTFAVVLLLDEEHRPERLRDWVRRLGRYRVSAAVGLIALTVFMVYEAVK